MGGKLDRQWYAAVLEEYKSLRAEAVTARDAQLSVLRLALPLIAALVGIGVSQKEEDELLAGILLSIVPVIVGLTFELWLGQVQRTIRAGSVVAAIEKRLGTAFWSDEPGAEPLRPPMGWEQWLRRPGKPPSSKRWLRRPRKRKRSRLSHQQRESTTSAAVTFAFLFVSAVGSLALGGSFLYHPDEPTLVSVVLAVGAVSIVYLPVRALLAVRGLRRRELIPLAAEVWPKGARWTEQPRS